MPIDPSTGPSLETYIETRLNLLTETIREQRVQADLDLKAFIDQAKDATVAHHRAIEAAMTASDLRYQQRFEAQSDALAAAFQSQQKAMEVAFTVAEKAVQAALAAADRAVAKAEAAADKRFEALNELRQMLNDMVGTLITRVEAIQRFDGMAEKVEKQSQRHDGLEARFNTLTGTITGGGQSAGDRRSNIAMTMQLIGGIVGIIVLLVLLWRAFSGN